MKFTDEYGFLAGWKRIAGFMRVSTRTAKRYKKRYGLPVHYYPSGRIYAIPAELITFMDELHKLRQARKQRSKSQKK